MFEMIRISNFHIIRHKFHLLIILILAKLFSQLSDMIQSFILLHFDSLNLVVLEEIS